LCILLFQQLCIRAPEQFKRTRITSPNLSASSTVSDTSTTIASGTDHIWGTQTPIIATHLLLLAQSHSMPSSTHISLCFPLDAMLYTSLRYRLREEIVSRVEGGDTVIDKGCSPRRGSRIVDHIDAMWIEGTTYRSSVEWDRQG
jgi:hypothetical protein